MKSVTFAVVGILVLGVILGTFTAAVSAMTAPIELMPREAVLSAERGVVEVQFTGTDTWTEVEEEINIAEGDRVRTGEASIARVNAFDQGELRLDAETEVLFEELTWDAQGTFTGRVHLETGRLWSRLMDFLSPDSNYQVETDATVAAVRGTAFSMEYGEMGDFVYVGDHLVSLDSLLDDGSEQTAVFEGDHVWSMKMEPMNLPRIVPVPVTERDQDWYAWNEAEDAQFMERMKRQHQSEAREARTMRPDSVLYGMVGAAERVRLMVAGEERRNELESQFMRARWMDAYAMLEEDPEAAMDVLHEAADRYQSVDEAALEDMMLFWAHGNGNVTPKVVEEISEDYPRVGAKLEGVMARREAFSQSKTEDEALRERVRNRMMDDGSMRAINRLNNTQRARVQELLGAMEGMEADQMRGGMMPGEEEMMGGDAMNQEETMKDDRVEEEMVDIEEHTVPTEEEEDPYSIEDYLIPTSQDEEDLGQDPSEDSVPVEPECGEYMPCKEGSVCENGQCVREDYPNYY